MEASCAVWIFALITVFSGETSGTEFVVTFLQNKDMDEPPKRDVLITGIAPVTTINVTVNDNDFRDTLTIKNGQTVTVPYPIDKECKGTGVCKNSMIITANFPVTAVSRNYRAGSGDVTVLYPVTLWGPEYQVTTPSRGPANQYEEFAVISGRNPVRADISLTGSVMFEGKQYRRGDTVFVNMEPYTAIQFQSPDNLLGTRIVGNYPVGVLVGHTCAEGSVGCGHIFDQLPPSTFIGNTFFVASMVPPPGHDIIYVSSSRDTVVTQSSKDGNVDRTLRAGEPMAIEIDSSFPVSLNSKEGIQVLLYGRGDSNKNQKPFLTSIPSTNHFGFSCKVIGQDNFDNFAIIISKTLSTTGLIIDGILPRFLEWKPFPGTDYSYAIYSVGGGFSTHSIRHLLAPIGVIMVGYSNDTAYGSMAPCSKGQLR